jgi:DNA-binding MarR family transcriptional regulator
MKLCRKKIEALAVNAGLGAQAKLAKRMKISQPCVSRILKEIERREVTARTAERFTRALRVKVEEILADAPTRAEAAERG